MSLARTTRGRGPLPASRLGAREADASLIVAIVIPVVVLARGRRVLAVSHDGGERIWAEVAMSKKPAGARETTAAYPARKLPILWGSVPLPMLSLLLPMQAKQLGATAMGLGRRLTAAQGAMVLCRPVIGRGVDRFGCSVFCLAVVMAWQQVPDMQTPRRRQRSVSRGLSGLWCTCSCSSCSVTSLRCSCGRSS